MIALLKKYKTYGLKEVPTFILTFEKQKIFTLDCLAKAEEYYSANSTTIKLYDALWIAELEEAILNNRLIAVEKEFIARCAENGADVELKKTIPGPWEISIKYETKCDGEPSRIILTLTKN
jgi:hypothetical protein